MRVEDQCPQGRLGVTGRSGQPLDDGLQERIDADSLLGRNQQGPRRVQSQVGLDLALHPFGVG